MSLVAGAHPSKPSPTTAAQRKHHRRLTREDNRYHSGERLPLRIHPLNPALLYRRLALASPDLIERRAAEVTAVNALAMTSRCANGDVVEEALVSETALFDAQNQ